MEWGISVVSAVLAAALGYAGGHVALLSHRRRQVSVEPRPAEASFRLEHQDGQTWSLVNIGRAPGAHVHLVPLVDGIEQWPPAKTAAQVETATSRLLPTLAPGDSMSVWFSRYDPGQRAMVSWTAESNVRMGPIMLDVPPPV